MINNLQQFATIDVMSTSCSQIIMIVKLSLSTKAHNKFNIELVNNST